MRIKPRSPQIYLTTMIAGVLRRIAKDAVQLVRRRERNDLPRGDSASR
ncbi:hypothetical protein [Paraburkholderia panacisoli]|nr:hypothetical protein [Paraburkholderia panacisoli]